MRKIFIDTGAFVALRNPIEREHKPARETLARLISQQASLFTSNHILAETYTALLLRAGRAEAIEWARQFRAGGAIELVRVEETIEDDALSILEANAERQWSYVDATSFALMAREGTNEAFAFDPRFGQRGITLLPG